MSKEENKIFLEKFILSNPFDFKQGIIHHCRLMDKIDVYEWVAEDELKIQQLQQKIDKAIEYIETATIDPQSMRHYRGCLLEILEGGNNE